MEITISQVADMLSLKKRKTQATSAYYDCPFCGGKSKLNLSFKYNVYRCNKCKEGGGVIDLYAKSTGTTHEDAKEKLLKGEKGTLKIPSPKKEKETCYSDIKDRNCVYEIQLGLLPLFDEHRENILDRGLPLEVMIANKYRSVPQRRLGELAQSLVERGCQLSNIPGFYTYKGSDKYYYKWLPKGFYIPVRDLYGNIQALQVRMDETRNNRYCFFSTSEAADRDKNKGNFIGAAFRSYIHYVGFDVDNMPKTVYLTEGALKADIAHALSGKAFIAVSGVNNIECLSETLQLLKSKGVERIVETFDMDKLTNDYVAKAAEKVCDIVLQEKLEIKRLRWDINFKGIDDFLKAKKAAL